jgi:hypothetical protein
MYTVNVGAAAGCDLLILKIEGVPKIKRFFTDSWEGED